MNVDNNKAMENRLPRPEIIRKVNGSAKFTADVYPDKVVYAKYIRFPYGKGRVTRANVEAARRVPGVLWIDFNQNAEGEYHGHRIGEIVAESRDAIGDAIEALDMQVRITGPATRPDELYEGVPDPSPAEAEQLRQLFSSATATVEAVYTTEVQTHSCLEPHGVLVDLKDGESAEAWVSTQSLMSCHEQVARTAGIPPSRVTVRAEYVGGGFGSKFGIGSEGNLAIKAAKQLGRPCRVILDREEDHVDGGNRPGSIQYMKIAVDDRGRIQGGRMHLVSTVGFSGAGGGVRGASYYNWGNVVRTETSIPLNAGLPRAFRAPGWPQASFAMEVMMDELAAQLNMDPVEFRKVNETSARRKQQLDQGAELIGWSNRRPDGAATGRIKVGYGCGVASWGNSQGRCEAEADVYRTGEVEVRVGIQDIGTGSIVLPTDVAAWHLGLPREMVTGKVGISDYPPGPASGGSVTSRFTAPAVRDAAQKAMEKVRSLVASEWGVRDNAVQYDKGVFTASGNRSITWKEACSLISGEKVSARGEFNSAYWGNGNSDTVQFARVAVDTETGIVTVEKIVCIQACGKPINRLTVENQIYGGVIQGISYALFENRWLDGPTGGQVNPDLLFYKVAGPKDIPEIVAVIDAEEGEDGVRSLGEPTTIPTAGAIANAIANAIGARVRSLPITPRRVLEALDSQGGATA